MKAAVHSRFQQTDRSVDPPSTGGRQGVGRDAPRYGLSFVDVADRIKSPVREMESRPRSLSTIDGKGAASPSAHGPLAGVSSRSDDHSGNASARLSFALPSAPVIQRKLKLDGGEELEGIHDLPWEILSTDVRRTAEMLILMPGPVVELTSAELTELHECMEDFTKVPRKELRIPFVRLLSHGAFHPIQRDTSWYLFHAKRKNLAGVGNFLRANPKVNEMLRRDKVSWAAFSDLDPGSAKFQGDQIHLSKDLMNMKSSKGFMRTTAHEIGHATLQRMLILKEHWDITQWKHCGEEVPAEVLNTGGKALYAQWKVLRKHPEYLVVQDLRLDHLGDKVSTIRGEGRQAYVAGSFTEFCAECFALLALNSQEFKAIIDEWCNCESVPGEVKAAWSKALEVLNICEARLLEPK